MRVIVQRTTSNAIATLAAILAALVCVYSVRQVDPDFWGYLDAGRLFASGGLTAADPFAYTSGHATWITFEYGAELALWWAYRAGGAFGLLALKALLGGACLAAVLFAFRVVEARPSTWLPVFLIAASGISRFFLFRPQLFTLALFAAFVLVLFRHLLARRAPLWCLPFGMILWVNTHGGFVAGLGAIGLALAVQTASLAQARGWGWSAIVRRTRPLWLALAASALATVINPLGWRIWIYVGTELTHGTNRRYIREWAPATFSNDAWSTWILIVLSAMLVVTAAAAWWSERDDPRPPIGPPPMLWAASAVPLLAMAFLSVRHTPLAAIWAGPVVALLADAASRGLAAHAACRRAWFVLRGLAVLPVLLTVIAISNRPAPRISADGAVLGRTHPCRAVAYLRAAGVTGHVYNPLWWGSYLTWHLYPAVRVAMDGRNITVFPDAMVEENLRFYTRPAADVDPGVPLRYDTDLLLVPADSPALARVGEDGRWRRVYADADAAIFRRADRPAVDPAIPPSPDAAACPAYFE